MKDVVVFEKVSFEEFTKTMGKLFPNAEFEKKELQEYYDNITLPERKTKRACGYDFVTPFDFSLSPGSAVVIPTGIRADILIDEWGLVMMPKSRNFRSGIRMSNTLGLIDPDYYDSSNEGHILIALEMPLNQIDDQPQTTLFGNRLGKRRLPVHYHAGDAFIQGCLFPVGLAVGDELVKKEDRDGGYGSTGN